MRGIFPGLKNQATNLRLEVQQQIACVSREYVLLGNGYFVVTRKDPWNGYLAALSGEPSPIRSMLFTNSQVHAHRDRIHIGYDGQ